MIEYNKTQQEKAHARRVAASESCVDGTLIIKKDTPIFVLEIGDQFNVAELISQHRKNDNTNHPSNVKAWRSSFFTHQETNLFDDVVKYLVDDETIAEYYDAHVKHECIQMWVMEYEKGNYAARHSHYPADWSAVFYAKMDEKSSPVVIENNVVIIWNSSSFSRNFRT